MIFCIAKVWNDLGKGFVHLWYLVMANLVGNERWSASGLERCELVTVN